MPVPETARVAAAADLLRPAAGEAALPVVYRLLHVELARQRGVVVPVARALEGVAAPADPGILSRALRLLRTEGTPTDDVRATADLHEGLLHPGARRAAGAYFTPSPLIELLLDEALEPALDETTAPGGVTVCDPACGSGLFLVAAVDRFVRRGVPVEHVLRRCVHGVDLDPAAVELTRVCLWLAFCPPDAPLPDVPLLVRDALLDTDWLQTFDVVVGNPPFLNRLERRTAPDGPTARRLVEMSGGAVRPYTDVSAMFLHRAVSWTRPGGRVALVQPQSFLAARDAAAVRGELAATCALESLWASDEPVFDAGVLACAVVLRRGAEQGVVRRWHGPGCEAGPSLDPGDLRGTWSHLVADALGVPRVAWSTRSRPGRTTETGASLTRTVGDVADCTADFRDQYYGLAPHVREAADCPGGVPLVTTGLIDPALSLWGERPTRFLKQRWSAPVIDLGSLAADEALARWARTRLVPKVLVGTQGKVVEAVADEGGAWLPSVPVLTVVPRGVSLWHLLAVLLAPPVSAYAAATYAGSGLTMRSIKLSARQVGELPLPVDEAAWEQGVCLVRRAQQEAGTRQERLADLGPVMCAAYDVPAGEVLPWWLERLR